MKIDVKEYTYDLPVERIAKFPLPHRDQSKLLVYNRGQISHETFADVVQFLPVGSTLIFNDTKVIPARLLFQKKSGAQIEIFLLTPLTPSSLLEETLRATTSCSWKCAIGNLRRWNVTELTKDIGETQLSARLIDRQEGVVEFSWNGSRSFGDLLQYIGNTPLPPYLNRPAESLDKERYQTIYSMREGAVAAPTAGLHFTPTVMESLGPKNISTGFLSLHVSAGTFQPIKVKDAANHTMHQEQMVIPRQTIETLLGSKTVIAVGTTSLRTLESLYWFGAKLIQDPGAAFDISQQYPYAHNSETPAFDALKAVLKHMDEQGKNVIVGETSIYIVPGYKFKICAGLLTNFHQPASTLILLVAAFVGDDWKKIYEEALSHDYRFLSYGDSSLLLSNNPLL
jgi:S-adenosylmethionine:tRNA ribosyltransferase-isomerase